MKRLFVCAAFIAVCSIPAYPLPASAEEAVKKSPSEAASPEKGSLRATREKFQKEAEQRLAAIDKKMKDIKDDTKEKIRGKKASLIRKMHRLEDATDRSWHRLKNDINSMLNEIENALKKDEEPAQRH